eukprot:4923719-Ditylum_brightwellii.AAC.1
MKKKANGTYQARLNARGYEQQDQEHYDGSSIAAPVANNMTIRIVMVFMLMAGWCGHMLKVHFCMETLRMVKKSTWKFHKGLK